MSTSLEGPLLYSVDDGIATLTLNRPERRNALSVELANALYERWLEVERDPAVRVVVFTSADCGTFCAGLDLKEAAQLKEERGVDLLSLMKDPFAEQMRRVGKPIIIAMTGHFMAGGIMLALNADIRVGLAGTTGGVTEARVGRGTPWAVPMLWQLPQAIAMELVMCAETMPIERFHQLGFVNYVEPTPGAVRARAFELARQIVRNAPLSVWAAKESLRAAMSLGCDEGITHAKEVHVRVYESQDAIEGPRAFAERRAPQWMGR